MNWRLTLIICLSALISCKGQKPFGMEQLTLEKTIELPGVSGRIDHMAIDPTGKLLYMAALGNNTLEVIDLKSGARVHTITGLHEPQGVCYLPDQKQVVVANGGNGECIFYDASSYAIVATINLGDDADNIRYDTVTGNVYVGYGNGGVAVINVASHKLVTEVKFPAHPESLQIDQKHKRLFVNLPDNNSIGVIDLETLKLIDSWKIENLGDNFPMTLDTASNLVIIGYRRPAVLVSYDATNGHEQSRTELVADVDDIFYDDKLAEVFASGGAGAINIFKKTGSEFKKIASIPTRSGARTSLLVPSLQRFFLAERSGGGKPAAVAIYKIKE